MLETHMKFCMTAGFSTKKILPQKLGKWATNGPKTGGFFNMLKNCVINIY